MGADIPDLRGYDRALSQVRATFGAFMNQSALAITSDWIIEARVDKPTTDESVALR